MNIQANFIHSGLTTPVVSLTMHGITVARQPYRRISSHNLDITPIGTHNTINKYNINTMNDIEKLKQIDILSNCLQKIETVHVDDCAYLIHKIINNDFNERDIYNEVAHYKILANKELFIQH